MKVWTLTFAVTGLLAQTSAATFKRESVASANSDVYDFVSEHLHISVSDQSQAFRKVSNHFGRSSLEVEPLALL